MVLFKGNYFDISFRSNVFERVINSTYLSKRPKLCSRNTMSSRNVAICRMWQLT